MATLASRRRKLSKEIEKVKKKYLSLDRKTSGDTVRFLRQLRGEIRTAMIGAEGFELRHLSGIKDEVTRAIGRFQTRMSGMVIENQSGAWGLGIEMVDNPLSKAGIDVAIPLLSDTQLGVLQGFSADLVTGLTGDMLSRINNLVSLGVVGEKNVYQTAKEIDNVLGIAKKKGVTDRAMKIARTEVGRAQSVASQLRKEQAKERVPQLKKQWVTGINPRPSHAAVDGQVVEVDDFFIVGGFEALFPRDPRLPPEEVVRCNCNSVPYLKELPA